VAKETFSSGLDNPHDLLGELRAAWISLLIVLSNQFGRQEKVHLGDHMTLTIGRLPIERDIQLSDGAVLRQGDAVGVIDFIENLPRLSEEDNLMGFVRRLFKSAKGSLSELAVLCREDDTRLQGIEYFWGKSHLAGPLAKRLGFEVFEVEYTSPLIKKIDISVARAHVRLVAGDNEEWDQVKDYIKPQRHAIISRERLMAMYADLENA